jgi:hypothetical protein
LLEWWVKFYSTDTPDEVILEVSALPAVEIEAKALHESHTPKREILFGKGVKSVSNGKRLLVKGSSGFPRISSKRPEVCIAEVLGDDETVGWIVADYLRYGDIDLLEKLRNVGIERVLHTLRIVMDQDGRILLIPS